MEKENFYFIDGPKDGEVRCYEREQQLFECHVQSEDQKSIATYVYKKHLFGIEDLLFCFFVSSGWPEEFIQERIFASLMRGKFEK